MTDNKTRGMLLIVGAMICFSLSDAMVKYISASLPAIEISFFRYVVFVIMAWGFVWKTGDRVRVRAPGSQIVRGLMMVCSALTFMISIRTLPMAEAATIGFVSPVLITILSVPMLGEKVGLRRWVAVLIGLAGVMLVARPGTAAFQPAAAFTFVSALAWSIGAVLTRRMSGTDAATTLVWTSSIGLAVMTVLLPFDFVWPDPPALGLALLMGAVATIGQYLLIMAYRYADASLLAPFSYTQLVWATILGYTIFGALPDLWTGVGAAIIVASSIASARSERRGTGTNTGAGSKRFADSTT